MLVVGERRMSKGMVEAQMVEEKRRISRVRRVLAWDLILSCEGCLSDNFPLYFVEQEEVLLGLSLIIWGDGYFFHCCLPGDVVLSGSSTVFFSASITI